MNKDLTITFWGARGSYPSPGEHTLHYGGNTACVEVNAGGRIIILDAGTGIIPLGRALAPKANLELLVLFSHLHHDHTQGFPFFVPAYLPNTKLHLYGPGGTKETVHHVLEHNQSAETFPVRLHDMAACKDIRSLHEAQVITWGEGGLHVAGAALPEDPEAVVIRIQKSHAHPGGVYHYRIEYQGRSVVYATDTEGYVGTDRKLVSFARHADVLIHDAQYAEDHYYGCRAGVASTQGFGHSTAVMAAEVAASAATGELILFHHDPSYGDDAVRAQELVARQTFHTVRAAFEGLKLTLPARAEIGQQVKDVQYVSHG